MRWHAARTLDEESSRPLQREPGEALIKTGEVARAYREWLARRGLSADEGWFLKNKRKRHAQTPATK